MVLDFQYQYGKYCVTHNTILITLNNVSVVLKMQKNLLSVSQLTKNDSCIFQFPFSIFKIIDEKSGKTLATASRQDDLYAWIFQKQFCLPAVRKRPLKELACSTGASIIEYSLFS